MSIWKVFSVILLFFSSCSGNLEKSPWHYITLLYKDIPEFQALKTQTISLSYTPTEYIFSLGQTIPTITANATGTIQNCTISPELPQGLTLGSTDCSISGTVTALLDKTIFTGEHHYAIIFNKQTKNI